jgi:D-threo-aldose 1-dehydrogenase
MAEPAAKKSKGDPKDARVERHTGLRELGSTGLRTTQMGLGGASLGDLFVKIPNSQALDTVTKMHGVGCQYQLHPTTTLLISPEVETWYYFDCWARFSFGRRRYFDTAPWYGLGLSEARMGLALSSLPRDSYALSTKVGRYLHPHGDPETWDSMGWAGGLQNSIEFAYSFSDIMRQYEDSVQRLGCGSVDCLVIHDIEEAEGQSPTHARGTREFLAGEQGGYRALEKLRRDGRIKAFGAGINIAVGTPNHTYTTYKQWNVEYFDFLLGCAAKGEKKIDFVLLAGNHTLLGASYTAMPESHRLFSY